MFAAVALSGGDAQADWSAESLGGMSVDVYAPEATSPVGSGRALMIVLHGCTQTAAAIRDEGNLEPAADSMGVVMAVPSVPGGGVIAGCWDYYGSFHTRTSSHVGPVLAMVEQMLADPELSIDPEQVYVLGLSSGGGEAAVLGCVAPDVFAGVGIVAGPSLGTESSEIGFVSTTGDQAAALCEQLAGEHVDSLQTQAGLTFAEAGDFTVAQGYNAVNAQMFGLVYADGLDSMEPGSIDLATAPGAMPAGVGSTYADADGVRIVQLDSTAGEGHAWPSGSGMTGGLLTYVNGVGLNMSQFAAEFFATNNPRVDGWDPGGETDGSETSDGGDAGDADGDGDGGGDGGGGDAESSTGGSSNGADGGDPTGASGTPVTSAADTSASGADTSGDPDPSGCSVSGRPRGGLLLWCLALLGWRRRRRLSATRS